MELWLNDKAFSQHVTGGGGGRRGEEEEKEEGGGRVEVLGAEEA